MIKISKKNKGIIYILLSAFFFALMNMFVALSGDIPFTQKSFFRNIIAFIFSLIIIIKNNINIHIEKKNYSILFFRAFFGTVGIFCNFYAVDHLFLSDATMLNKLSPFFAIIFSFFILKEKLKLKQMVIVLIAFVVMLFIVRPSFSNVLIFPSFIGLLGGLGAGVAYTFVRLLGERGVKGPVVVCFFSLFSSVVTIPFLFFDYTPMSVEQWFYLLLAGFAATGGQFFITAAYFNAPAKEISVYDYSQLIFAAMLGYFVLGQIPDKYSILGYIIIIFAAILMFLYKKNNTES